MFPQLAFPCIDCFIFVCMYVCVCVCMYVCMYVCMHRSINLPFTYQMLPNMSYPWYRQKKQEHSKLSMILPVCIHPQTELIQSHYSLHRAVELTRCRWSRTESSDCHAVSQSHCCCELWLTRHRRSRKGAVTDGSHF